MAEVTKLLDDIIHLQDKNYNLDNLLDDTRKDFIDQKNKLESEKHNLYTNLSST